MDSHKNAPLTAKGREAMVRAVVEGGLSQAAAARQFNVTPKTVAKWVLRFRAEGVAGLQDRSSRPRSQPSQTAPAPCARVEARVEALRRHRCTGKQIAAEVGVSAATVSRILKRLGLNRLAALEPAEPVRRYERAAPGEILHIDIKSSASSIASVTASPATGTARATPAGSDGSLCIWRSTTLRASPTPKSCPTKNEAPVCFVFNALRFFRSLDVKVRRVMTDNG